LYNPGSIKAAPVFMEQMKKFVELSHPGVMPIVGLIPPGKRTGTALLTPYSECRSLADVLEQIRRNRPPAFWNSETITKILFNLVTGFKYLHLQGIVRRDLKPSDIIVHPDGTAKICDNMTSFLEDHMFTTVSQAAAPCYMAPEMYGDGPKETDLRTDVFS
jgi:serine/threonine protein kinase